MNKSFLFYGCLILGCFLLLTNGEIASASDLVYSPINPSFGGNPNNGVILLNEANAQNSFSPPTKTPLQQFNDNLTRSLLERLASDIVNQAFGGAGGVQPGHYDVGNFSVDVTTDSDGLGFTVNIADKSNGNSTTVQVPFQ